MTFTINDEITDEQFAGFFAQHDSDNCSVADFCGADEDFDYVAVDFEQIVANVVYSVFGGGPSDLPPLVKAPDGVDLQFDLIADFEGVIEGGRFLLHSGWEKPVLASPFVESKHLIEDRDLKGVAAAISVARTAQNIYRQLVTNYERLIAPTQESQ